MLYDDTLCYAQQVPRPSWEGVSEILLRIFTFASLQVAYRNYECANALFVVRLF